MSKNVSVELETLFPVIQEVLSEGKSFTFAPKGVSMLPLIRQGEDSVTISPANHALKLYDVPLYRRKNGQFVLHRVVGLKNGKYVMCGDNQHEYEYGIDHSSIIGVMSEIIKPDKTISVNDKDYIQYARKRVMRQKLKGKYYKFRALVKKVLIFLHLYK